MIFSLQIPLIILGIWAHKLFKKEGKEEQRKSFTKYVVILLIVTTIVDAGFILGITSLEKNYSYEKAKLENELYTDSDVTSMVEEGIDLFLGR